MILKKQHFDYRLLAILAFLSGMCGIAYEQLYQRMLTLYLSDDFSVNAAILSTFLLGIGCGSLIAYRFSRWLGLIEGLIGLYAFLMALGGTHTAEALYQNLCSDGSFIRLKVGFIVGLLLAAPSFLIGFSVPLFAEYLEGVGRKQSPPLTDEGFNRAYILYNVGAAFCLGFIEYLMLRKLGLQATLMALGLMNLAVGALVQWLRRSDSSQPAIDKKDRQGKALHSDFFALTLISIVSGMYQLIFLKQMESFFGPFHENFTLCLAVVLVGLSLGTWVVKRFAFSFDRWLASGLLWLAAGFALLVPGIWLWTAANGLIEFSGVSKFLAKTFIVFVTGLTPFLFFGGTVPALLSSAPKSKAAAGKALAYSSFGNCIGYLAIAVLIFERLTTETILVVLYLAVAAIAVGLGHIKLFFQKKTVAATVVLITIAIVGWNRRLFVVGYATFSSVQNLQDQLSEISGYEVRRRLSHEVSVVTAEKDRSQAVVIDGYQSLIVHPQVGNPLELLFGVIPAIYPAERKDALVLGLGTGISGGAAATFFGSTTAVEINPAMIDFLPHFSGVNLNIAVNPKVTIVEDDGIAFLRRTKKYYDVIYNTVTNPLYFSSAKLYTRDFFKLAKARLSPGGVYALWMDNRASAEGAKIIFQTLQSEFADCHAVFLRIGYVQLICSAEKLPRPKPIPTAQWDARLLTMLGWVEKLPHSGDPYSVNDLLDDIIFEAGTIVRTPWSASVNTFDRPVLEYLMADRSMIEKEIWNPYDLLNVDYGLSIISGRRLSNDRLGYRCFILEAVGETYRNQACLRQLLESNGGFLPRSYLEASLSRAITMGGSEREIASLREQIAKTTASEATLPKTGNFPEVPQGTQKTQNRAP